MFGPWMVPARGPGRSQQSNPAGAQGMCCQGQYAAAQCSLSGGWLTNRNGVPERECKGAGGRDLQLEEGGRVALGGLMNVGS